LANLPVIVGIGGVNAAGRLSGHHAYRRLVIDALPNAAAAETYRSLAGLMGMEGDPADAETRAYINDHTLIRRIEQFDPNDIGWQRQTSLTPTAGESMTFNIPARQLPERLPDNWTVLDSRDKTVTVRVDGRLDVLVPDRRTSTVSSAAQIPTGFNPGSTYQSRNHPRGLELTIWGASDAIRSIGMDWDVLRKKVRPDQFAVYSGSAMGQMDQNGAGGMLQAGLTGGRVTSRQLALGLCEMPADFINAYVLGSLGATGATIGACATFLYNLRQGIEDIRSGRRRVVVVGNAEAPITPEVVDGYRTMGALAEDEALKALDSTDVVDNRRACRPFAENCGFTLAEASVYTILFDDELALETGAFVHGAVADVYVNADGFKKSIPGPGVGNYVTVAKAMGLARSILGEEALRQRTYMHAHGTGTPQNRVTESHIMSKLARIFGIAQWPVAAVKAHLGHSLAPAGGDQLSAILGAWAYGWIPGITSIDAIADDVHTENLQFTLAHREVDPNLLDAAFINSKGFGGNNATGLILAPHVTRAMLERKHGAKAIKRHAERHEDVAIAFADYDERMTRGEESPIYRFGEGVLEGSDLEISDARIEVPGYGQPIELNIANPYPDMSDSC
jgi:acetoacetyl-[acyl-carrier protein] synthase